MATVWAYGVVVRQKGEKKGRTTQLFTTAVYGRKTFGYAKTWAMNEASHNPNALCIVYRFAGHRNNDPTSARYMDPLWYVVFDGSRYYWSPKRTIDDPESDWQMCRRYFTKRAIKSEYY